MPYANIEDYRAYQKAHYEANRDKRLAQNKAWRQANRDKVRAYDKAWRQANPDKRRAYDKAWKQANPDKIRAWRQANRDKVNACIKAWEQANPEKHRARSRAYYARNKAYYNLKALERRLAVREQTPAWNDRAKMLAIYAECSKRNEKAGYIKWHVDHIVPLRGKNVWGLHVHTNLRIILASENRAKSNKYDA